MKLADLIGSPEDDFARPGPDSETEAYNLLSQAIEEVDPSWVFVMLSGGNDSRCAAAIAMRHPRVNGCVLIDTGIAIREAHESVKELCRDQGWPLRIINGSRDRGWPKPYDWYAQFVRKHGFPGPPLHVRMYQRLKERAVEKLVREHRGFEGWWNGIPIIVPRRTPQLFGRPKVRPMKGRPKPRKIMLVSGIRKRESEIRYKAAYNLPVEHQGGRVWVSPLYYWNRSERNAFLARSGIPENPISPFICGMSGDCCCGAMADPNGREEKRLLDWFYPETGRYIDELAAAARANGRWDRWGEKPPEARNLNTVISRMFLCAGCELRHAAACEAAPDADQ